MKKLTKIILLLIIIVGLTACGKKKEITSIDDCFGKNPIPLYYSGDHSKIIAEINIQNNQNIYELLFNDNINGKDAAQQLKLLDEWNFHIMPEQNAINDINSYQKLSINKNNNLKFDMQLEYNNFVIFRYSEYSEHNIRMYYNLNNGYYILVFCQSNENDENYSKNEYFKNNEDKFKTLVDLIIKHTNIK